MSDETAASAPSTTDGRFKKPVKVVIDGREITAEAGHPLLQVALDNGIEIPHYCYHPKLSIDGSCRMCQVRIEKAPKLAIACNTPVTDGMVVDTTCDEVAFARKGVMELLLINHPLDCPICDQAGECYLQDYSFGYGSQESRTSSPRRKGLKRHPIGERVIFDQERCILCRRCVRFTKEISKTDELRVFGIGDKCPPISATKALTGHSLGATGVQEAIYSLLMMNNGFVCESAHIQELDPVFADMPIVRKRIDNARLGTVLSNSFGFGGTNATLVFKRMDA